MKCRTPRPRKAEAFPVIPEELQLAPARAVNTKGLTLDGPFHSEIDQRPQGCAD